MTDLVKKKRETYCTHSISTGIQNFIKMHIGTCVKVAYTWHKLNPFKYPEGLNNLASTF